MRRLLILKPFFAEQVPELGNGGYRTPSDQRYRDPTPRGSVTRYGNENLYADISGLLSGDRPEPPKPVLLKRFDGNPLLYSGQVNCIFGDTEAGKTFIALGACVEALIAGRRVLILDMDHNGEVATVSRLIKMGAPCSRLVDQSRFRYCEPEDGSHIRAVIADCRDWRPAVVVFDSIGELMPMRGANSNSSDEFTLVHTSVLKPLALVGAAVIAIDHPAKGRESASFGPGGTNAKRRALGGLSLRVVKGRQFIPGKGGTAALYVNKDRHGGIRAVCPPHTGPYKEQPAGTFVLEPENETGLMPWHVLNPCGDPAAAVSEMDTLKLEADIAKLNAADLPPTTVSEARVILACQNARAAEVFRVWRERMDSEPEDDPDSWSNDDEYQD